MEKIEVKRDNRGFWIHPDLPEWDEGTTLEDTRKWFAKHGLTCDLVIMEGELADKWGNGEIDSCLSWEPEIPNNSFLVGIWDTEDGVVAMYAEPTCEAESCK